VAKKPGKGAPSFRQVARRLKQTVESGRLRFTRHAREQMQARGLTVIDIGEALARCVVVEMTGREAGIAAWKYRAEGRTPDGARIAVVAGLPDDANEPVSIVSAWRIDA